MHAVHAAVKIDHGDVAVFCGTIFYRYHTAVAFLHLFHFVVDVFIGDNHFGFGHFQALVAFNGNFGLHGDLHLEFQILAFADLNQVKVDFIFNHVQPGFFHGFFQRRGIQHVDRIFIESGLAVILFNESTRSLALPETGDGDLLVFSLENLRHGRVKISSRHNDGKFVAVGLNLIGLFQTHYNGSSCKITDYLHDYSMVLQNIPYLNQNIFALLKNPLGHKPHIIAGKQMHADSFIFAHGSAPSRLPPVNMAVIAIGDFVFPQ